MSEAIEAQPLSTNRKALVAGLSLMVELVKLRDRRRDGDDADQLGNVLAQWTADRQTWWDAMAAQHAAGAWMPLVLLSERLGLTDREVDAIVVALAPHIDPEFLDQVTYARASILFRGIDVELLVGVLFHSTEERFVGQSMFEPTGALVANGLVELVPMGTKISPHEVHVRATESLINFVLERPLLSGGLSHYCELTDPLHRWEQVILDERQKEVIRDIVSGEEPLRPKLYEWGYAEVIPEGKGLVFLFAGPPGTGKTAFAHAIAQYLNRRVLRVHTSKLTGSTDPLEPILTEVFRVGQLANAVILIDDCETLLTERNTRFLALLETLDRNNGLLVLTTNNASNIDFAMARRILYRLDFEPPNAVMREQIWEIHLPASAPLDSSISIGTLANSYEFTGGKIRNTVLIALTCMTSEGAPKLTMEHLREAADTQLGARFDDLAVKTGGGIGMDRLVLPEKEMGQLKEVLAACKHREFVLNQWGFGKRLPTGRGLCVLFDGPPGTGKTFTAEILSEELKIPLYRVHIPNIVSKWVGETERNIAEIFTRARAARAMLLFDEADSLFGRRSTSQQSANDRYANMEVNLLLQEIERYDGITVLTTNLFGNLDDALQRRIQFRVTFPFPEPEERANIWEILMPPEAPTEDTVDFSALGKRFELAGGHIKNALLRAAYRAREDGGNIGQTHLADAAIAECQAQGKIVRAETPKTTRRASADKTKKKSAKTSKA